jgi:poly [ADP-ribose] polymerase
VFTKSVPKSQKMKLKGGATVDPDSNLDDEAHVYRASTKDLYSAVLGKTDLATGQNSYYKLQVLESDVGKRYWLFRSWGRIGTTIGGTKTEDFGPGLQDAIELFESLYEEKSGIPWRLRGTIDKVAGKMAPLEMHDGTDVSIFSFGLLTLR